MSNASHKSGHSKIGSHCLTALFLAGAATIGSLGVEAYELGTETLRRTTQAEKIKDCQELVNEDLRQTPVNYIGYAGYDSKSGKCTYTLPLGNGFFWITIVDPKSPNKPFEYEPVFPL